MKSKCVFCSPKIKERAIKAGWTSYVLLSNPRVAIGHLLIIPNRHIQKLSDLNAEEVKEIFKFLGHYQDRILEKLSVGTEIRQNFKPYFPDSTTHVNHFHFHIIPRSKNDEISKMVDLHRKPLYKSLTKKEQSKITKILED